MQEELKPQLVALRVGQRSASQMDEPDEKPSSLLTEQCARNRACNPANRRAEQEGTQRISARVVRDANVWVDNGFHPCPPDNERVTSSRDYLHAGPPRCDVVQQPDFGIVRKREPI